MNILLYSPSMFGHPQVYCRVIADILVAEGHQLVIASSGQTTNWVEGFSDLAPLLKRPLVHFENTRNRSARGIIDLTVAELKTLQDDYRIDSTLLVLADRFSDELVKIAENNQVRLRGRVAGIFSDMSTWYPGESNYGGHVLPPVGGTLRERLVWLKQRMFHYKRSKDYFYEEMLLKNRVIDSVIVKDERILEKYGDPVCWMPEIFHVFDSSCHSCGWNDLPNAMQQYIQGAGKENVVLYFGSGAFYKGYDIFLKLLESDTTAYGLHVGSLCSEGELSRFNVDVSQIRKHLQHSGRLFETGRFEKDQRVIAAVYSTIERFVSTHRLTLSSGTMLQALTAGKPVLTAGSGYVGYLTNKYQIGHTYRYGDIHDLTEQWIRFRRIPVEQYSPAIDTYMKRFSQESIASMFKKALGV